MKYLITIPCVNREERNAVNVIDKTFQSFIKSGLFESKIPFKILLFDSGSKDLSYLDFINEFVEQKKVQIEIIKSTTPLNAITNTFRMFLYLSKLPKNALNYVIWMDDDVFVCKNFIENADIWLAKYGHKTLFSSLYIPYESYPVPKSLTNYAKMGAFYGTCCTIFQPTLAKYIIPMWFDEHFQKFEYNPDARFREILRKQFPKVRYFLVSNISLVEHMNIGSSIYKHKNVNKGHKSRLFIGEENDPKYKEYLATNS